MPLYEFRCDDCGDIFEGICSVSKRKDNLCGRCDGPTTILIAPVMTVGPMPSKPFTVDGHDIPFHSNGELRDYKKANPKEHFLQANDKVWTDHVDDVRNRCEAKAKKMGYRDLEQRRKGLKEHKKTVARLESGEKKIIST